MKLPGGRPAKRAVTALAVLCTALVFVAASLLSAQAAARQCRACQQPVRRASVQQLSETGAGAEPQGSAAAAAGGAAAAELAGGAVAAAGQGQGAAAAAQQLAAPAIPKIFHRIYIADPEDATR